MSDVNAINNVLSQIRTIKNNIDFDQLQYGGNLLVLYGEHDDPDIKKAGDFLAENHKVMRNKTEKIIVPGANHLFLPEDKLQITAKEIKRFLSV